ncbi:hypothetical protein [Mesorhizobium sp. SP-1A]|uniref:hypothetical protein n=1 Tax=Mesorhizobium sp. SP-1A TaxID=3077840 RepID=UPI0028F6F334|nr:hypothetical protein [Mesorhizobium sp. SP-1A]
MTTTNITTLTPASNLNPSFFHGWTFISFEENYADDALPFQTFADFDGPTVLFNPSYVSRSDLEKPFAAMIWVPLVLQGFATSILTEAMDSEDDIGAFTAPRWEQFREAFCQYTKMEWEDVVARTEEFGIDYMAEYAIEALFIESGIHEMIVARKEGNATLRVA